MSKKIRIKIRNIENLEYELLENATMGDYFSLKDGDSIPLDAIKKNIDLEIEKYLTNEKKALWLEEYKKSSEYCELVQTKIELEKLRIEQREKEKAFNHIVEKQKSEIRIENLDKISKLEKDLELARQELKNERQKSEINLVNERQKIEIEKQNANFLLQEQTQKWEIEKKVLESKWQLEQKDLQIKYENEISNLKRERSFNSKIIGENLENWLVDEYNEKMSFFEDSLLSKDNQVINNTKGDFIFEVFDLENKQQKISLGSVMIEAKSQSGLGSKKNENFFRKLDQDRKNKKATFALLVSELEPEQNFVIKKVFDYPDMFIVRPQYFLTFLSLVRFILLKKKDVIKTKLEFENSQKILEEFDKMKNDILDNSLRLLAKDVEDLTIEIEKIEKSTTKLRDLVETKVTKHKQTIENKIENFNVKKIIKKIESIH